MIKKTGFLFILLLAASISLVGCSSNNDAYFKQINIDEANKYFEGNQTGFILLVTDNDEYFVPTVERLAKEKKVEVVMYNPYQSDGENDNKGTSIFPNSSEIKGDAMYYLEKNEVTGELSINSYTDSQLAKEVMNFMDLHN